MPPRAILRVGRPVLPVAAGGVKPEGGVQAPNTVNFDPYLYPPPGSQFFNLVQAQAIAVAGTLYNPANLTLGLPRGYVGVINAIVLQLDGITLASNVLWSILVTGSPYPGFGNITIPGISGAAAAVKDWAGTRIEIPVNGSIGVRIQNVDGAAYTATTSLYGWYWQQNRG